MKAQGMGAAVLVMVLASCGGQSGSSSGNAALACGSGLGTHTLIGTASGIHDGDTLTLQHASGSEVVRLQGIDAPELAQPWGNASRQALDKLAGQQPLSVVYAERDRYGRVLGHVFNVGTCDHLNSRLLNMGMAWYYRAYACDLPAGLRTLFDQDEQAARWQRLGLWQQAQPVAPWVYRNGEDPPEPVCSH